MPPFRRERKHCIKPIHQQTQQNRCPLLFGFLLSLSSIVVPLRIAALQCCWHSGYNHSCWWASFLACCLGGRPALYNIYIPHISLIYSMYIYNYMHIWRAGRNVKTTPANNYGYNRKVTQTSLIFSLKKAHFFDLDLP